MLRVIRQLRQDLHSSTRPLMTAVCLPWREGPPVSHWHTPGNTNGGRVVCVKPATEPSFKRAPEETWQEKHQADSRCHLWKSLGCTTLNQCDVWKPTSMATQPSCPDGLWECFLRREDAHWGTQENWEAEMQAESMEGQHWVTPTHRPQRSNMSHLSWPLVQVF